MRGNVGNICMWLGIGLGMELGVRYVVRYVVGG